MHKFDVMVVGDINIDLVVEGCKDLPLPGQEVRVKNMATNVGGGAALFAMGLSKLGIKTKFYGVLGNDIYGDFIRSQFERYNIETSDIEISSLNNTGISISVFGESDRAFITYDGSNCEFNLLDVDIEAVSQVRHIHITGYKGRSNHEKYMEFVDRLKHTDVTISTDVGWDETGEWYDGVFELISNVDVFFINEVEALNYTRCDNINDALKKLSIYCKDVAVKMGNKGAVAQRNKEVAYEPAFKVEVIDTTGAGDSFNAGYIYGFLKGETLGKCLLYGNGCGGLSVTKSGGNTGFPDSQTLEDFIQQNELQISV